jgi:glycosyltransferase involved in cell wall biosynthesis
MQPAASVVICTHNRAAMIARTLDRVLDEVGTADVELVAVDNASTDDTPRVLAGLAAATGGILRTIPEAQVGLSAARNRGLASARGEVAVFLDDDAVPHPGWLAALLRPYDAPAVACTGGPIRVHFPTPPPAWVTARFHPTLGALDLGSAPRRLAQRPGEVSPSGGNISFRTAVARRLGGFSVLMGRAGGRHLLHEEADLCQRVVRDGGEIWWVPDALVDHWVLPERLDPRWFLNRFAEGGRSAATCALRNRGLLRALWGIRWYGPYLAVRPYAPEEPIDPERLLAECQRREALGYVASLVRGIPHLAELRRDMTPAPVGA